MFHCRTVVYTVFNKYPIIDGLKNRLSNLGIWIGTDLISGVIVNYRIVVPYKTSGYH